MKLVQLVTLVACVSLLLVAATDGSRNDQAVPADAGATVTGGLATLRPLDGETCSLSLLTGAPGGVVQDHELRNRASHLEFGRYNPGEFTVGIQGGESGRIVDLGTAEELRQRFEYTDTLPGRQGSSSLHLRDGRFAIRGRTGDGEPFQACPDADRVLAEAAVPHHAPVALDHVYVLRITDRHDPQFELVARLHVVGLEPGQSVTLRWERLTP
jgi:hypothetical protein